MAKITFGSHVDNTEKPFKKGDLVLLKEGQDHNPHYKRRPVIVTADSYPGAFQFSGFCLVDSEGDTSFRTESFELAPISICLSN